MRALTVLIMMRLKYFNFLTAGILIQNCDKRSTAMPESPFQQWSNVAWREQSDALSDVNFRLI
jgi:hypothetical protein